MHDIFYYRYHRLFAYSHEKLEVELRNFLVISTVPVKFIQGDIEIVAKVYFECTVCV